MSCETSCPYCGAPVESRGTRGRRGRVSYICGSSLEADLARGEDFGLIRCPNETVKRSRACRVAVSRGGCGKRLASLISSLTAGMALPDRDEIDGPEDDGAFRY